MSMDTNTAVSAYIEKQPSPQKEVLAELRKLIHASVKGVKEEIKWGRPVYGLKKDFCYLKAEKNYVTLGFMDFNKLSDPEGRLEGTGKSMRHVKIGSIVDIDNMLFSNWLVVASACI